MSENFEALDVLAALTPEIVARIEAARSERSGRPRGGSLGAMRTSLSELLATGRPLLADGATGTNYFAAGPDVG